jgi:xanthine dehydrogenase accessory factor
MIKMMALSYHSEFRMIEKAAGEATETTVFLESVIPRPKLFIAGAGHIGKALAQIASMLDFEITIIDDRPEFANPANIPCADHIITGDIGKAFREIGKGPDTYLVIVTRGHRDDGKALRECIGSDAAYIGMIGSRNKTIMMRKEFLEKGWATEQQWERIHAPIGLEINSQTVGEIAVSIAAQLVWVRNVKDEGGKPQGAPHNTQG